ncbi:voltage-dependent anion channel [Cryomyces antarcticus]
MTMATGGIANMLYAVFISYPVPHDLRFPGLYAIGCLFFILNIVLFIFNVLMISARFYLYPSTFKASILHPTESLFVPAAVISYGTILLNVTQWSTQTFTISQMTPVWIFPAYPLLIVGPHAGQMSSKISRTRALDVIIGGVMIQGIGFMVSLMIYSAFLYRLMTQKLPKESIRPGMFISVGPTGFTISGMIDMGRNLPRVIPDNFMGNGQLAGQVSMILANWIGIWLWGLALWFFLVSTGVHWSCVSRGRMDFAMTWYSFIFPNTALTTATFAVANALDNQPIRILGCVMVCLLVLVWMCVFAAMIRAVVMKDILWPQKQEDRDEGGWSGTSNERDAHRGAREGSPTQLDEEPEHRTVEPAVSEEDRTADVADARARVRARRMDLA